MTLDIKESILACIPNVNRTHLNALAPFLEQELGPGGSGESIGASKNRLAMFLAQCAHESGAFRYMRESGPLSYFKQRYSKRAGIPPTSRANYNDLDYWYIGRGILQITFLENYTKVGEALDIDLVNEPSLLEDPDNCVKSAIWFWNTHNLNKFADVDDCRSCTKRINGGYNGLQERLAFYNKFKAHLNGDAVDHLPTPLALTNFEMSQVQTKLQEKGYHECGDIHTTDDRTVAAVCALQHNEGITINGIMDQDTLDALDAADHREISSARATGVPKSTAATAAKGMLGLGTVTTVVNTITPVLDQVDSVKGIATRLNDLFTPLHNLIASNPQMVLVGVATIIAILGYVIYSNLVSAFRQGKSFDH